MNAVETSRIKVGDYVTIYHSGGLVHSGEVIDIGDSIMLKYEFGENRGRRFVVCTASVVVPIEHIASYSIIEGL